jgi:hypothetical protein
MYDLIFFALLSGGLAAMLALAYMFFTLAEYAIYKAAGGRKRLFPYLKKYL